MINGIEIKKGQEFNIELRGGETKRVTFSHITKQGDAYLKDKNGKPYWRNLDSLVGSSNGTKSVVANTLNTSNDLTEKEQEAYKKKVDGFSVERKFAVLERYTNMIIKRKRTALLVTGRGGTGKTHTVGDQLENEKNKQYLKRKEIYVNGDGEDVEEESVGLKVIGGYTTAKGLYNDLYYHNGNVIVFDDCDDAWNNPISANILKRALDSDPKNRVLSWKSEKESEVPNEFKFTGRIIFVSNKPASKFDQALLDRTTHIDLHLTNQQMLDRINGTLKRVETTAWKQAMDMDEFGLADELRLTLEEKKTCWNFLKDHIKFLPEYTLSYRTFIEVLDFFEEIKSDDSVKPEDKDKAWKQIAEYALLA